MTVDESNRIFPEADLLADEAEAATAIERPAVEMTVRLAENR